MEITGRITKDAVVNQRNDDRQVINFTVAINDYYKPKNSSEGKKITTFINCSYWLTSKIVQRLTKGTLVELSGRIGVNAYVDLQGEAKATKPVQGRGSGWCAICPHPGRGTFHWVTVCDIPVI